MSGPVSFDREPLSTAASSVCDTEIGIEEGSGTQETELISTSVSVGPPGDPRSGLPDFAALIEAEIAAAQAANDNTNPRPSALGAGELVLTARELTGLSQRRLAARLGTSQPTIATIESGNRTPTIRTLMRIAGATGFELVIGLRSPGAASPKTLGALVKSDDDGLADYIPMRATSPFEGPPDR